MTAPRRTGAHEAQAACVLQAPPLGRRARVADALRDGGRSRAEAALADPTSPSEAELARAAAALRAIRQARIGGTFWAGGIASPAASFTLLRPRTEAGARAMLAGALERTEAAALLLWTDDRPWARRLRAKLERMGARAHLGPADPWPLLDQARVVETEGDDPLALLALAAGVGVRATAECSLAGWGLTRDADERPPRGSRTLDRAAHAALIAGAVYVSPFTGEPSSCEEAIETLSNWRRLLDRNSRIGCCTGMAVWKRSAVSAMLQTGAGAPPFRRDAPSAARTARRNGGGVAVWRSRVPRGLQAVAARAGAPVLFVEDGFLRSAGLGSNLTAPCSIVVDSRGAHYDPNVASDLETLLGETTFEPALLARAERLIAEIVRLGLTKYNVGDARGLDLPRGRRRVLVPGQVADDLSVRLGGAGVSGSLDLLARVRAAEPDALILFKPHPDVEAGHRPGAVSDREALGYADRIVRGPSIAALLPQVDAVHVLTSLTGFEALLRGRDVVVHGQPFYAGWGLTRDLAPPPRRGRKLSLAELVAGALILYPTYLDPVSRLPCPPEVLAARLARNVRRETLLSRARQIQGRLHLSLRPTRSQGAA